VDDRDRLDSIVEIPVESVAGAFRVSHARDRNEHVGVFWSSHRVSTIRDEPNDGLNRYFLTHSFLYHK
jgi:hypothetical protein